jgi:hypothetical protein
VSSIFCLKVIYPVNDKPKRPPKHDVPHTREARLNAALRENLQKRKQQGRKRDISEGDLPPEPSCGGPQEDKG